MSIFYGFPQIQIEIEEHNITIANLENASHEQGTINNCSSIHKQRYNICDTVNF